MATGTMQSIREGDLAFLREAVEEEVEEAEQQRRVAQLSLARGEATTSSTPLGNFAPTAGDSLGTRGQDHDREDAAPEDEPRGPKRKQQAMLSALMSSSEEDEDDA